MPPLGIFVTRGGGVPHFHFRHGGSRGDGSETPAVWKSSAEIMEGAERGMYWQEGTSSGGGGRVRQN